MVDPNSPEERLEPDEPAPIAAGGNAGPGADRFDLETLWRLVEDAIPAAGSDPFIGTTVGGVRLERVVGEGGMGRVYEGLQEQPARTVAVKLQRPGRMDPASTKRFLRELGILGALSHPSLCHVYQAGFLPCGGERLPWFVMEYVADALPITEFAENSALPLRRRVELFRDVCAGVAAAHAAGVVHRDLKAGNILVGSDGVPKVIDFGVATAFRGDLHATSLTRRGHLVGTLETTAPELLDERAPRETPRTDVWSLGVVLHELVTGTSPFRPEDGSVMAAIQRIRAHRPNLAARAAPGASRALARIVDRALAPAAADRHADAAALERDLASLLERHPEGAGRWSDGGHLRAESSGRARWLVPAMAVLGLCAAMWPWIGRSPRAGAPRTRTAATPDGVGSDRLPAFDPPAFATSPIERADFRHVLRDVEDPEADRYLVESSGMRKWLEDFGQQFTYWGPDAFGVEGRLVFRYDFARPSRRIHLKADIACKKQNLEDGIIGDGTCAVEYSKDGLEWRPLVNHLENGVWGEGLTFDGLLPEDACGGTSLWLRVRLLAVGAWKKADYTVAQFCRKPKRNAATCFELDVEYEPAGGAGAAGNEGQDDRAGDRG